MELLSGGEVWLVEFKILVIRWTFEEREIHWGRSERSYRALVWCADLLPWVGHHSQRYKTWKLTFLEQRYCNCYYKAVWLWTRSLYWRWNFRDYHLWHTGVCCAWDHQLKAVQEFVWLLELRSGAVHSTEWPASFLWWRQLRTIWENKKMLVRSDLGGMEVCLSRSQRFHLKNSSSWPI